MYRIYNILYLFIILACAKHVAAQKITVSLNSDLKSVLINDQITFTVKSNISGDVNIDFPKEFSSGYGSMNGMEQEMDYNTGAVNTTYYFSQNGFFKTEGTYTFNAYITNRKKVFKSNAITIKVTKQEQIEQKFEEEICKKALKQPIFGIIQKSKSKIYEGEPLILEAKIYSKLNINMLQDYIAYEIEGGAETKEIEKKQRLLISKVNFKGQNYLTFEYDKKVLFPSEIGKLRIKPFEMTLEYDNGGIFSDQVTFLSNSCSVEVLPLPTGTPNDFIGAVGEFNLNCFLDKKKVKKGEIIVLKVIIGGTGNLQNIEKPKIKLPKNSIIYGDPEIEENFDFTSKGATGKITYTYNIQIKENDNVDFPNISISYFNPEKKKYIRVEKSIPQIKVIPSNDKPTSKFIASEINKKQKADENIPYLTESSKNNSAFYMHKLFWPSVISPFLVAFLGFIFISKREENKIMKTDLKTKFKAKKNILIELENLKKEGNDENYDEHVIINKITSLFLSISKLNLKKENCSKSELLNCLKNQLSENQKIKFNAILISCEEINYSYTKSQDKIQQLISNVNELINDILKT
jgi:hypothetical protein